MTVVPQQWSQGASGPCSGTSGMKKYGSPCEGVWQTGPYQLGDGSTVSDVSISSSRLDPSIVWVLPLLVWPYANTVQLMPCGVHTPMSILATLLDTAGVRQRCTMANTARGDAHATLYKARPETQAVVRLPSQSCAVRSCMTHDSRTAPHPCFSS